MNILKKLTKKNLMLNKKRTIVTIIGIVLSTALIVCVSGMVTSFQHTLLNHTIEQNGNYHAVINDMERSDVVALENNRNIKDYYLTAPVGYATFDSKNKYKPFIYVESYDKGALENYGLHLESGRMPTNSSEIVLPINILEDGGFDKKIGDTITLNIGNRYVDSVSEENLLDQNNPYISKEYCEGNESDCEPEFFVPNYEKTYTIVGFIERLSFNREMYSAPGYTSITYLDKIENHTNAVVLYKNAKDFKKNTKEIVGKKYSATYHRELLRWLGVSGSETMGMLYAVAAVVIGIIIVSSVFVIKNSFSISITEKYKMYGMLRSVGATSKQIKKNVLYEGFVLGLIAIPLGILCGCFASFVLVHLINFILGDYLGSYHFVYSVPLLAILLSIVLASLTIYFSTIFMARKASKISAIEAIRSNQDIKIKSKKLKTPKFIEKLFKTGGVIAYKNLKRNKKKYRTTVVSIAVSVFVFLALSSFIDFGFKMSNVYYTEMSYNFHAYSSSDDAQERKEDMEKIASNSLVERYSLHRSSFLKMNANDYLSDFGRQVFSFYGEDEKTQEDSFITVMAIGTTEYERLLNELHLKPNENQAILIDDYMEYINKKTYLGNLYKLKNHEIIKGATEDKQELSLEIIRSDVRPMGLEQSYITGGYLLVSDEIFDTYFKSSGASLFMKVTKPNELANTLDELQKENKNIRYTNYEEMIEQSNAMVLIISIFLYGFITVISLIGMTNIFNTITTNMNLRSKEFAMLKSVGMTRREFNRMIRLESIFYGTKALFYGIPLGLAGSFLIYKAFEGGLEMDYIFPWKSVVIAILFVMIIIGIIMKYSLNKINKQNIIETIRNDNI